MKELLEERAALVKRAEEIVDGVKSGQREISKGEVAEIEQIKSRVGELDAKKSRIEEGHATVKAVEELFAGKSGEEVAATGGAKSIGEHFAKEVGAEGLARLKSQGGVSVGTTWFKAATDPHVTGGPADGSFQPWLTDVDKTLVHGLRQRPVIADLLGTGAVSGNAVTYFVESPTVEGGFANVAEAGQKPQLHIPDPTPVTDPIRKIAAWWDNTDEMIEDLPFYVSEINNRGLDLLAMHEEDQLLNGNGTGANLRGLLNRSGIQTESYAGATDLADGIFRAITKIQTATGLSADGIVINPADYQTLRLSKDANGQYFGGGIFTGQYGNGGILQNPGLWGLNTVVSSAVAAGSPVVGAFKTAATVYRKGGVRVESTNSDQGKFTTNIVTTRIEERIGLAVRVPAAIVKLEGATTGD